MLNLAGELTVEEILERAQVDGAMPMDHQLVDKSLICPSDWDPCQNPFDTSLFNTAREANFLKEKTIVFDLDDTLLCTNYSCKEDWSSVDPLHGSPGARSIRYSQMKRPLSSWVKFRWLTKPPREQFSNETYPFLKNPDVCAQFRPGILSLLLGLKEAGVTLVLASLCRQSRMNFLFERIPVLQKIFGPATGSKVIPCERLLRNHLEAKERYTHAKIDRKTAMMTQIKSRESLRTLTSLPPYDLLVDDSHYLLNGFQAFDWSHVLPVASTYPHSSYAKDILEAILSYFIDGSKSFKTPIPFTDLEQPVVSKQYPFLRFEDPLYFPEIVRLNVLTELTNA